jgi:hypothetical protein
VLSLRGRPEFDSEFLKGLHEEFRLIDRRSTGTPYAGRDVALVNAHRFFADYPDLDVVPLAVRGERLAMVEYRGRTQDGYEATYLSVNEVDGLGRLVEQVRFDESDFEGAYRELEQRYYASEGASFAAGGALQTEHVTALIRDDVDRAWGELTAADFRFTSRSRSVFGDRSAADVRASGEELASLVGSMRRWASAVCWLTPTICVQRGERRCFRSDGEKYAWTRIYTSEVRDGLLASICEFEVEDEVKAFDYGNELRAGMD